VCWRTSSGNESGSNWVVDEFDADLFLSSHYKDVQKAIASGFAAASIVGSGTKNAHDTQ
jgi:5'-nucleotidase